MKVGGGLSVASSSVHGRGLFAARAFQAGQALSVCPLLILSPDEVDALKATQVYNYIFHVADTPDGRMQAGVAFGPISLCNHSTVPNATFQVNGAEGYVVLTSTRAIRAGEEILIDYGDFAENVVT